MLITDYGAFHFNSICGGLHCPLHRLSELTPSMLSRSRICHTCPLNAKYSFVFSVSLEIKIFVGDDLTWPAAHL